MNNMQQKPLARTNGIIVRKLEDEVLIYDIENRQAHCLDKTASVIWEHCDGNRTIQDFSSMLNTTENLSQSQKEQIVWLALDQLSKSNLLEEPIAKTESVYGLTRRQVMKTLGAAGLIAIPVVSTIVAPTAAQASTCLASGQGCGTGAECCSGLCSAGTCV